MTLSNYFTSFRKLILLVLLVLGQQLNAQTLFEGGLSLLGIERMPNRLLEMKVVDKNNTQYIFKDFIKKNKLDNNKPCLIVPIIIYVSESNQGREPYWNILKGYLDEENISRDYNVVALFMPGGPDDQMKELGYELNTVKLNKLIETRKMSYLFDQILFVSTTYSESREAMYDERETDPIFISKDFEILLKQDMSYYSIRLLLDKMNNGLLKTDTLWFNEYGNFIVNPSEYNKPYYTKLTNLSGDRFTLESGSKNLLFYRMGFLKKNGHYLYDGEFFRQSKNNTVTAKGSFKEGIPLDTFKIFYESGKPAGIYPVNGFAKAFDESGELTSLGPVKDGLGDGQFSYFKDKEVVELLNYKLGIKTGLQRQSKNYEKIGRIWQEYFLSPDYETIDFLTEGLQRVSKNELMGYVDRDGKVMIPFQYVDATNFKDGIAQAITSDSLLTIDKTGKILKSEKLPLDKKE